MKKSATGLLMINLGSVTRGTQGMPVGFFLEGAPPPFYLTIYH